MDIQNSLQTGYSFSTGILLSKVSIEVMML